MSISFSQGIACSSFLLLSALYLRAQFECVHFDFFHFMLQNKTILARCVQHTPNAP